MPWQQEVADVVGEVDPDTGQLAYSELGLTVPRQSGKSTLLLAKAVHRAMATDFFGSRQRVVYTAQTRHKAREKWEEDYAGALESSRTFASRVVVHKGNGNEHIRFPNGSRFGIEANTEKAGHGPTVDEAYLDEAFSRPDTRGESAFRPAMITRRNKMLAWVSTRGWRGEEPYLLPKIELGRARVEMGVRHGLAYFEWSAPDGTDPYDRSAWWRCMPALGHTITEEAIVAELDTIGMADFCRAYLNMAVPKDTADDWTVIGREPWRARQVAPVRPAGPVLFAVACSWPDAAWTSLLAIGQHAGRVTAQVLAHRPGSSWAVAELVRLSAAYPNVGVALDAGAPAGRLVVPLEAGLPRGVELVKFGMQETARAFGLFLAEVSGDAPRLAHFGQPEMDDAVRTATKRPLGDGFTWAHRGEVDITALEAATVGLSAFLARCPALVTRTRSAYEDRGFAQL